MQVNEKMMCYRHPFMKAAVLSKYEIRFLRVNEVNRRLVGYCSHFMRKDW